MMRQVGMDTGRARMGRGVRWQSTGADVKMEVYIDASPLNQATLAALRQHGVHVLRSEARFGMVYATMPLYVMETVVALPFVRCIRLPVYSIRRTGSVTSAGD